MSSWRLRFITCLQRDGKYLLMWSSDRNKWIRPYLDVEHLELIQKKILKYVLHSSQNSQEQLTTEFKQKNQYSTWITNILLFEVCLMDRNHNQKAFTIFDITGSDRVVGHVTMITSIYLCVLSYYEYLNFRKRISYIRNSISKYEITIAYKRKKLLRIYEYTFYVKLRLRFTHNQYWYEM